MIWLIIKIVQILASMCFLKDTYNVTLRPQFLISESVDHCSPALLLSPKKWPPSQRIWMTWRESEKPLTCRNNFETNNLEKGRGIYTPWWLQSVRTTTAAAAAQQREHPSSQTHVKKSARCCRPVIHTYLRNSFRQSNICSLLLELLSSSRLIIICCYVAITTYSVIISLYIIIMIKYVMIKYMSLFNKWST